MGDIIDMKGRIENTENNTVKSISNLKELKNLKEVKKLPKLTIKGVKDVATLIGPTAGKYNLTKNQRTFQIRGRVTLTAIAAALAVSGLTGVALHNRASDQKEQTAIEQTYETLQKDTVLANAENAIIKCVFGDNLENIKDPSVKYVFDDNGGTFSFSVWHLYKDCIRECAYEYTDSLSIDRIFNNKDIVSLIDNAINVHNLENPSQKDLYKLNEATKTVNEKSYKLNGKYIVETKEKDKSITFNEDER